MRVDLALLVRNGLVELRVLVVPLVASLVDAGLSDGRVSRHCCGAVGR